MGSTLDARAEPARSAPDPRLAALRTVAQLAIVGAVVAAVLYYLLYRVQRHGFFDLRIYRDAVQWWLDGHPLYSYVQANGFGFTYPPFAAISMTPMAYVSFETAAAVSSIATAVAITGTTWWLVAPVAERHGWPRWFAVALAVPIVSAMEPVRETMGFGQVNLFLVALIFADTSALRRGRSWAGMGIGLAMAVKLTPGLFLVYLLLTRRWRAAAVATSTFLTATLLAAMVDSRLSWQFWTETLWQTSRVGRLDITSNQSILGFLARVADPGSPDRELWLLLVCGMLVLGMSRAVQAFRAGDDLAGITLTGLTACLLSPISWTHHLYWVIPATVVLIDVAAGTPVHDRAPAWLRTPPRVRRVLAGGVAAVVGWAFVSSVIWPYFHGIGEHHDDGLVGVLGESAYALLTVALVLVLPIRALRVAAPASVVAGPARVKESVSVD